MQLKQFYDMTTKVNTRKKCYYFWWSTWLFRSQQNGLNITEGIYFQMLFHKKTWLYLIQNLFNFDPRNSLDRWQAITWTNDDHIREGIYVIWGLGLLNVALNALYLHVCSTI